MDTNDTPAVDPQTNDTPNPAPAPQPTPAPAPQEEKHRPTLSDEEQLAVLEGRAKRLRTKLGMKDEPAPQASPSDDLVKLTFLRAASITDQDEVDLALSTAEKWNMPLNKLVDDEDFKGKLEKLRTQKANELAASGINGGPGSQGKNQTPEFFIARGTPPSREEVPDRKTRVAIAQKMAAALKGGGGKFYNDN